MKNREGRSARKSRNTTNLPTSAAMSPEPSPITRRLMTDQEALSLHTPYYPFYGNDGIFEVAVFHLMGKLCSSYTGGQWNYYVLSNGAWYMAPEEPGPWTLVDIDGRAFEMSGDGAGLAVTLYVVNHLSWMFHAAGQKESCEAAADHYHALRMYTYPHADAVAIWRVLD